MWDKFINHWLAFLFAITAILAVLPVLREVQYRYLPVVTEFYISEFKVIGSPTKLKLRDITGDRFVTVDNGYLFSGSFTKSKLYPKSLCEFKSVEPSDQNSERLDIIFGDQPPASTTTRVPGKQSFYNWYVEREPRTEWIRFDFRHKCFGFFPTLQTLYVTPSDGGVVVTKP